MFKRCRPIVLLNVHSRLIQLPMCVLLKHYLERDFGCRVILTSAHYPGRTLEDLIPAIKPDLVIPSKAGQVAQVQRVIETHRGLFSSAPQIGFLLGDPPAYGPFETQFRHVLLGKSVDWSRVSFYFCLNDFLRQDLLTSTNVPPDRVHSAGVPRFDFYFPPLNALIVPRERMLRKYGLDPRKPTISVASTPINLPQDRLPGGDFPDLGLRYEHGRGQEISWSDLLKDTEAVREALLSQAMTLARTRSDWQVIVRPHPNEDAKFLEDTVRSWELPNVTVTTHEYVWDVLNAVDLHIHRYCTTGFEAWLLDKPTIDFRPTDYACEGYPDYTPGNIRCDSPKELLGLVEDLLGSDWWRERLAPERGKILDTWFQADGQSTWRHAEMIGKTLSAEPPGPKEADHRRMFSRRLAVEWNEAWYMLQMARRHRRAAGVDHKGRPFPWFTPAQECKWARGISRLVPNPVSLNSRT